MRGSFQTASVFLHRTGIVWTNPQSLMRLMHGQSRGLLLPPVCWFMRGVFQTRCALNGFHADVRVYEETVCAHCPHSNCTREQQVLWRLYETECWWQSARRRRRGKHRSTSLAHGSGLYPLPVPFAHYQVYQGIWLIKGEIAVQATANPD